MNDVLLQVATYQGAPIRNDIEATLKIIESVLVEALSLNIDLVLFPELFLTHYDIGTKELCERAVSIDSNVMARIRSLASTHSIAFAIGYPEVDLDGVIYNS